MLIPSEQGEHKSNVLHLRQSTREKPVQIPPLFLKAFFHNFTSSILEYFVSNNGPIQPKF